MRLSPTAEKRCLQAAVVIGSLVPLLAGGAGMLRGPGMIHAAAQGDLDSHYRYLSGLLFGIGIGFLSCVPGIEAKSARFRLLAFIVITGGVGRALGWLMTDALSPAMTGALVMELAVTPLLALWQARVARRQKSAAM